MTIFVIFLFARSVDCGYTLDRLNEAILAGTRGLCFGAEIGGMMNTLIHPSFTMLLKVGCKGYKLLRRVSMF